MTGAECERYAESKAGETVTKEILIIRLSSVGDVIHCTPVASTLKAARPDWRITWLVGEAAADLVRYNPDVDEVLVWSRERFERHLGRLELGKARRMWLELEQMLAGRYFDAVLDVHGLFLTGLIARLAGTQRRIGMSGAREFNWLFMSEVAPPVGRHVTDRYLGVLKPLGIATFERGMRLTVPDDARRFAESFLRSQGISPQAKIAVLVPATTWRSKNWPASYFAETARLLARDFAVVLCGGKAEAGLGETIAAMAKAPVVNAAGRTGLLELAALVAKAAVVVTADTGPLHIAAALGTPTVAVFGPTDPAVWGPEGDEHVKLTGGRSCLFCHKRSCPKGDAGCMRDILPAAVVRAVYMVAEGLPPDAREAGNRPGPPREA